MILKFPDLNTLRLALISGAVPSSVALTPATAGYDEQEALWVESNATLGRGAQNELKKLGVLSARASGSAATADVTCWPELLPLQPDNGPLDRPEQTPILFDLPGGEELSRLVIEILRLGNDRQGYRWLDAPDGEPRVLLRVVGPPYYSLLRAVSPNGDKNAPHAYVERAPRVWVELGWTHPLVEQLKPAEGKLLLLQPPNRWTQLDDAPFRDIYEVLEFPLPDVPSRYTEGQLADKIRVTPSLKKGGSPDVAEFWVLTDGALEEVNQFVQNAEEQLLHRLNFAVGEKDGQQTVVLRVRQSKLPPPELVLKAQGYRAYQKLPNLFLPVGTYLHPKLRRDVVRAMFADDPNLVTWLARREDGSFTPHRIADDAFRPLIDWIDYVLDHDRQALTAWVQAAQFEFEAFVCDEDVKDKPKKPPSDKPRTPKKVREGSGEGDIPDASLFEYVDRSRKPEEKAPELDPFSAIPQAEPSELQKQRQALEEKFLAIPGGLDAPERQDLWPELAAVNTALGESHVEDAGVCWVNAMWNQERVAPGWAWNWFWAEASAVPNFKARGAPRNRSWVSQVTTAPQKTGEVSGEDLDRLLANGEPSAADVRALAAYVVWASVRGRGPSGGGPAALAARMQPVLHFLEKHEHLLPVRAAWLAWLHLVRLSRGDVLALARARDRLLERLFHNGLRPELNMPSFLRFAGQPSSTRFRGIREWMLKLCKLAQEWVEKPGNKISGGGSPPKTTSYIELIFAYGLARLGEVDSARALLQRAKESLSNEQDPHVLLYQAFEYRIDQVFNGKTLSGPLPSELLEYLEHLRKNRSPNQMDPSYIVDRLRAISVILEPHQRVVPYRHVYARNNDFERLLADISDQMDRNVVAEQVKRALAGLPKSQTGQEQRSRLLRAGLEVAPRVSEDFALDLLNQATALLDSLPKSIDPLTFDTRAALLEKALFVAAHFDRLEHIGPLVNRLHRLLDSNVDAPVIEVFDSLVGQCFRGLRKLGVRDEIQRLLAHMAEVILKGSSLAALQKKSPEEQAASLRSLLHVASGWYYFDRHAEADPILQAARQLVLNQQLPVLKKVPLVCGYFAALGQGDVKVAQKRLEEVFTRLDEIRDTFTTNTFYSQSQLRIVEAAVLAIVSDDFTMGSQARRWLDDDEFLARRRIHRDLKAVMAHA